jgi:hypothetical protein
MDLMVSILVRYKLILNEGNRAEDVVEGQGEA